MRAACEAARERARALAASAFGERGALGRLGCDGGWCCCCMDRTDGVINWNSGGWRLLAVPICAVWGRVAG